MFPRIFDTTMCAASMVLLLGSQTAGAKVLDQSATINGLTFNYKVVLPKDYDPGKAYPAILAFPPGDQSMNMVQTTLQRNWSAEAQKRGYIVAIPAAPNGHLFFEEGSRVFPGFLNKLLRDYKIRDNKFHIAGMSNGGISAFHIAASYPQYFLTVTGFPGYLEDATPERVNALAKMCINMHAGELDTGWLTEMQEQAAAFRAKGFTVRMTVEKGQSHVIGTLTGEGAARLFNEIENCSTK
jgi:poly(3-hydroxybutyrate) depolymerase